MPTWKKVVVSGSAASLNSLNVATNVVAQSFTGSLFGTSSYASQALSSSYSVTSSYALTSNPFPYTGSARITGSLDLTGSAAIIGDVTISGTIRATTKSFLIDHPVKRKKKLQYGALEGPEHSVYIRGRLENTNKIYLPYYWYKLICENTITVNLTAIGTTQNLWVKKITNKYIEIDSDSENINCFYTVYAERKDIDKLIVEFDKV